MMTFDEYAGCRHAVPYVLDCADGAGRLLYYGSRHIFDRADPEVRDIEQRWAAFHPTLALNEGGDPPVAATVDEAVQRYGEPGFLRWLAARDSVPCETFEPPMQAEADELLRHFTAEQVKLFYTLRSVMQDAKRPVEARAPTIEELVGKTLQWLAHLHGLEGPPRDVTEFEASCRRLLPAQADWRAPPGAWFDPVFRGPAIWTNRVARCSSEFRDRFIVERLVAELKRGKRVFAVIGASHVVMQEPVLRARLERVTGP